MAELLKEDIKLIAFHLPQYHTFKENDEWWGEGFTEWVNVKKAVPLYQGHNQPRVPLDENYYNMLEKETRQWQASLAEKYGIYGFCYYHYWFDGHLLMEKPVEHLLEDKDIKENYCMCWANEPWTRAWDGAEKDVLMPQRYGDKKDWKTHFDYLLPFFKDDRYIKVDNRPMFVLYRTESITHCDEMIAYWDQCCKENGFEGIYIVEELNSFQSEPICHNSQAVLEFEPMYTIKHGRSFFRKVYNYIRKHAFNLVTGNQMRLFSYEELWNCIIRRKKHSCGNKKCYLGAFPDWDNSARKGKKGIFVYGATVEKFKKFFTKQIEHAVNEQSEFVFINAWNEWAEGTYLEPDEKNEYGYLEAIQAIIK